MKWFEPFGQELRIAFIALFILVNTGKPQRTLSNGPTAGRHDNKKVASSSHLVALATAVEASCTSAMRMTQQHPYDKATARA